MRSPRPAESKRIDEGYRLAERPATHQALVRSDAGTDGGRRTLVFKEAQRITQAIEDGAEVLHLVSTEIAGRMQDSEQLEGVAEVFTGRFGDLAP
jgi:hypothetical protein